MRGKISKGDEFPPSKTGYKKVNLILKNKKVICDD